MNKLNETIYLPSGLNGTYEELKVRFQNNEITDRQDLKELKRQAQMRFESHTAGIIGSFIHYDLEVRDFFDADVRVLENTLMRVMVGHLREAAVIKGDDVVIKYINEKMQMVDDNMLDRCEFERTMVRCPHIAENLLEDVEYE